MLSAPDRPATTHRLLGITIALAALTALHDVDHVRQGRGLPFELYGVAALALLSIGTTLVLVARRHPLAAAAAVVLGVTTILGVGVVHVAPQWSSVSDSYAAAHVDALSWAIIGLMMVAGLALALVAWPVVRLRAPYGSGRS